MEYGLRGTAGSAAEVYNGGDQRPGAVERVTVLQSIGARLQEAVCELDMHVQRIEGIMHRAGIELPPPAPTVASNATLKADNHLSTVWMQVECIQFQVAQIGRIGEGLAELA